MWFYVAGILKPAVLAPDIDSSVLVGYPAAEQLPRLRRAPLHHLRARPPTARSTASTACSPRRPTPRTPARSTSPSPPPRWSPRPTPRARSTPCSSAWARSPCWSARSAWPTSWSSPSSNAAPRSGCAAPSAPPRATSAIQFLAEAILLALLGGAAGVAAGAAATAVYAHAKGWATVIPADGLGRRPRRRPPHRRRRRAPARPPRRPPLTHPGPLVPLTRRRLRTWRSQGPSAQMLRICTKNSRLRKITDRGSCC